MTGRSSQGASPDQSSSFVQDSHSKAMSLLFRNSSKTRTQFLVASSVLFGVLSEITASTSASVTEAKRLGVGSAISGRRRNGTTSIYKQNTGMNFRVKIRMRVRCCYCPASWAITAFQRTRTELVGQYRLILPAFWQR